MQKNKKSLAKIEFLIFICKNTKAYFTHTHTETDTHTD